jgi:gliding motility-associated protein GldM
MASYKETPRQKMIAMMYLVLTALLALNVSKEMLDAFLVVNESMEITNKNFSGKIDNVYSEFKKQYKLSPTKVKPFYNKALKVNEETNKIVAYIDSIKYALIIASEHKIKTVEQAKNTPLVKIKTKDKYTEPTRFFFQRSQDGSNGESGKLKRRIDSFRERMLGVIGEPNGSERLGLITKGPYYDADDQPQTWMQHNFYYTILAADITILNKLIGEIQSAEFDVISYLFSDVTAEDFKFDEIKAKVISNNSYILKGQKYEAEVLVAAYDTKQTPKVYIRNSNKAITDADIENKKVRLIEGKEGIVKLSFDSNKEGVHQYSGVVEMRNPEGETIRYPFSSEYVVAPPSLTVAATKMNVFYIGVENPVSISVPGIAAEKITPKITKGCTLKKVPNGSDWIVKVPKGLKKVIISAEARVDGKTENMGNREFRVKRVPDPVAEIAGTKEGSLDKNTLLAASAIIPMMKDFEFDLNFVVNSFTMGTIINGDWIPKSTRGNRFSNEMKELIRNSKRGQKFFFENIQASGPDGTTRTLNTVNLTIK